MMHKTFTHTQECSFCRCSSEKTVSAGLTKQHESLEICERCVWDAVEIFRSIQGKKFISDYIGVDLNEIDNIHKKANIFNIAPKCPHKSIVPISYWEYATLKKYINYLENEVRKLWVRNCENSTDFITGL